MRPYLLALALPAVLHCEQAKSACNSEQLIPPIIVVVNATTGAAVCDATVSATGPSPSLTLTASAPYTNDAAACEYGGLTAPGSYTLVASKAGFNTVTVANVSVEEQSCGASTPTPTPQLVTISLEPGGDGGM